MNKISLQLIVVALALTGCFQTRTQTRTVDLADPYVAQRDYLAPPSERKASINDLNQHALRRDAHVTLADSRVVKARNLQVAPDSTSWFEAETGLFECVATAEVQQVRFVRLRNTNRMVVGFLAGAAGGAALGALIGYAGGDTPRGQCCGFLCENGDLFCTAEERAKFSAVLVGSLGGVLGASFGGSRSQQTYRFEASAAALPVVVGNSQPFFGQDIRRDTQ